MRESLVFKRNLPKKFHLGPVQLPIGTVLLRYISPHDGPSWSVVRVKNESYLSPWEPTVHDWLDYHNAKNWYKIYDSLRRKFFSGRIIPLVIEVNGCYVGQLTIGNIIGGALSSAWMGYWIDQDYSGMGVATAACALTMEYVFLGVGLHRLEATVRPENIASVRVLTKLGFRQEGFLYRYMHIDGQWSDHLLYAITEEEYAPERIAELHLGREVVDDEQ